jgi:lambda family phage tail tape measure protein
MRATNCRKPSRKRAEAEIEANSKIGQSQQELMAIQRQFDLQTLESGRQQDKRNADAQFQIDLLGKSSLEVAQLCAQRQIELDLEERIYQLRKKDPGADVSQAIANAEQQKLKVAYLIEESYIRQREGAFGASEAMRKYADSATNTAQQIEGTLTNAFKSAEDAFVNFVMTGKLSFKDLARSIIADLVRIQAQKGDCRIDRLVCWWRQHCRSCPII